MVINSGSRIEVIRQLLPYMDSIHGNQFRKVAGKVIVVCVCRSSQFNVIIVPHPRFEQTGHHHAESPLLPLLLDQGSHREQNRGYKATITIYGQHAVGPGEPPHQLLPYMDIIPKIEQALLDQGSHRKRLVKGSLLGSLFAHRSPYLIASQSPNRAPADDSPACWRDHAL